MLSSQEDVFIVMLNDKHCSNDNFIKVISFAFPGSSQVTSVIDSYEKLAPKAVCSLV